MYMCVYAHIYICISNVLNCKLTFIFLVIKMKDLCYRHMKDNISLISFG